MQRAAIVPHQDVAGPPHMLVDEARLLLMIEQRLQDRVAFRAGQAFDLARHQAVDVERLAARRRMRAHRRMPGRCPGIVVVRAARRRVLVVGVERTPAGEALLDVLGQGLVGRVGIGEQGVAALSRDLDGIEHGRLGRNRLVALIGVELHLAVRQRADRLPVLADVRNQHHGGMLDAEAAAGGHRRRRTEHLGKAHLRVLVQRLVAQQDHQILVPGVEKFLLERLVDRIAQVDSHDLGAERR